MALCNLRTVWIVALLCLFIFRSLADDNCPERAVNVQRRCKKSCQGSDDCISGKKKCLCDGPCGRSCINPNIRCASLPKTFPNGKIDVIPFNQFGAVAKYICNDGYVLNGVQARVCQGGETWSGEEPTCVLNTNIEKHECGVPPPVSHAHHDGRAFQTKYDLGMHLNYECEVGYTAARESATRAWCVGSGVWVGPNMTCSHSGCPLLPDIPHGWVVITPPNNIGAQAVYHCENGFFVAGRPVRECQPDGSWGGKEPSCESHTCQTPPLVTHASLKDSSDHDFYPSGQQHYPSGTQLRYTCDFGYTESGTPRAMCNGAGDWVGLSLTCRPKTCGFPGDIDNSHRTGYSFNYLDRVVYHCHEGYDLIGQGVRTCQANGQWSGDLPFCEPVHCEALPAPLHGTMNGDGTAYGTVFRFSCNDGYKLKGSNVRHCEADRVWSGNDAICDEINCGWPGPFFNGYVIGHKTTVGSSMFYQCNVYTDMDQTAPSLSTECREDGTWSHAPPICWGQCHVPSITNATLVGGISRVRVPHGTVIHFNCLNGLVPNDTSDVKCHNGSWTYIPKCVPSPCSTPPPPIRNGMRIYLGTHHMSRAKYICSHGYRLRGLTLYSPFLKCHYGVWKGGQPVCEKHYCPNPGSIDNGILYKKGTGGRFIFQPYIRTIQHGNRLEYECNQGFRVDGFTGATCVNGEWQPPIGDRSRKCVPSKHPVFRKLWYPEEELEQYEK